MQAEIQLTDGLPVLSTRKIIIDDAGTLLVGTDAGLHVAPNYNSAYKKIQNLLNNFQVWDVLIKDSSVYVATYNKGLFIFNQFTGELKIHYPFAELPKIRKLRLIQGQVFCITSKGVFSVSKSKNTLIFYTKSLKDEKNQIASPMDVFIRNGKLHVLTYGYEGLWQQEATGVWKEITKSVLSQVVNREKLQLQYDFPCLTAKEINGDIYFGGVNEYLVWGKNDKAVSYSIEHKPEDYFAIWDWVVTDHHIYGASGNVDNFTTGGLILHNSKQTIVSAPKWNQSIWSMTYDPLKMKLWIATNTGGVFMQNNIFHSIPSPFETGSKKAINNFIFCWNKDTLRFKNTNNFHQENYETVVIPENVRDVFSDGKDLFIVGRDWIYKYEKGNLLLNKPQKIAESLHSPNTVSIQHYHWLFPMYAPLALFNSRTNTVKKFPFLHMADAIAANTKFAIYHSIEKGFFITDKDTVYPLTTNSSIPHFFYADFTITENYLLLKHANSLLLFKINSKTKELIQLNEFALPDQFRGLNILKLQSNNNSFLLQTANHILELDVIEEKNIRIKNQIYLGNYKTTHIIPSIGGDIFLDRKSEIQRFALKKNEINPFKYTIISKNVHHIPIQFVSKLNETQNYQIAITGADYLQHTRYIYTLRLFNLKSNVQSQFFFLAGSRLWINSLPRGRYIATLSNLNQHISTLWISVVDYYFDVPFYLMLFLFVLFTMGVYFNIKQSRISIQRRIAILRLQTLRLNFNPHFIYNSMGLIQSLIVQNNSKKAIDVTARLARLNRVFLSNSTKDLIGLDEEMRFIKDYVDMEQLRFEDDNELRVNIIMPSKMDLTKWLMPPLILQPLVENAIKHGLLPSKKRGIVSIELFRMDANTIKISITNPATKLKSKSQSTGMGNKLVNDRIEVFNSLYKPNFQAYFTNYLTEGNNYVAEIILSKTELPPP